MKKNNRFSRLINLLTILGSGKSFTFDEIAKLCDVSARTIYRDLKERERRGEFCVVYRRPRPARRRVGPHPKRRALV